MDFKSDFLVIGSGIAGLSFSLKVARYGTVALVTKKAAMESSTNLAQGGIASVMSQIDSFDLHIQDTLASGDGLCNPDVVEMVVTDGPERIRELVDLGVQFTRETVSPEGAPEPFDLGREGGHSQNRIVHAQYDGSCDRTGSCRPGSWKRPDPSF